MITHTIKIPVGTVFRVLTNVDDLIRIQIQHTDICTTNQFGCHSKNCKVSLGKYETSTPTPPVHEITLRFDVK